MVDRKVDEVSCKEKAGAEMVLVLPHLALESNVPAG